MDPNSLDNISWRLGKKILKISVNPNQLKLVEIPVTIVGEVSGNVFLIEKSGLNGQGRILVCIYNSRGEMIARSLSESDGYFSYLGLPSGDYTASVDSTQLDKLKMFSTPAKLNFKIRNTEEGDIADGIDFTIEKIVVESAKPKVKVPGKTIKNITPKKKGVKKIYKPRNVQAAEIKPVERKDYMPLPSLNSSINKFMDHRSRFK